MADTRPTAATAPLEVDFQETDKDSAYNDTIGTASYRTSISESIKNYKYENGRRYHAYREGSYILPNDEEEQDRLDLCHHLYRLLLGGKLFLAPIPENSQRVLDLGTGTGIWAIDFADEYPSAQVIGTDLSPIQPKWVPPNCTFEIDDFENEWLYTRPFDYIHGRELMGFIADHDRLFSRAFKHLKPGGWFEVQTTDPWFYSDDGTHEKATNCKIFLTNLHEAGEKFGKSMGLVQTWKERMIKAGFVDVHCEVYKLPIGPWPKDPKLKELGRVQQVQQIEAIGPYTLAPFTRILGWTREEVEVLCAGVRNELKDRSLHLYVKVYFVYGRKPKPETAGAEGEK
ncbi:hypothetical protein VTN00DRAFT_7280 [Thermoascus crustaceus]|uniref:uncharacterized protein n=1 Tax=Thermoascus crustaceus TaxID=5088 RepID=UPI0037444C0C